MQLEPQTHGGRIKMTANFARPKPWDHFLYGHFKDSVFQRNLHAVQEVKIQV
jgi:hypothetical protein